MTFSLVYAFSEQFILPLSHDEVVHGKGSLIAKMPGDDWQKRANLRALYAYMWSHPGKQLLFMGQEFGQGVEWNADNSLDWWLLENPDHVGIKNLISDLNALYKATPALWTETSLTTALSGSTLTMATTTSLPTCVRARMLKAART